MAKTLPKPIINTILPFDPSEIHIVSYYYDGDQTERNRAVIQDATTYETIYDSIQIGGNNSYIIPANTLTPGNRYVIQIQVYDYYGNSSQLSDQVSFYCFSTPVFSIDNVDGIVNNASVTPIVTYIQDEGETVKSLQFFLYDSTNVVLESSPVYYSIDENSYTFGPLKNGTTYYVRTTGETIHGIYLDTGYIEFVASFAVIPANTVFSLDNNYNSGYVTVTSNIRDVGYVEEHCALKNGILTIEDGFLEYNQGFELQDDAYIRLLVKQIPLGRFLQTNSENLILTFMNVCDLYYIELKVNNYVIYKQIDARYVNRDQYALTQSGKSLYIEIIRKNNIYDIRTEEEL